MIEKKPGYQYNIFDQAIAEKKEQFKSARSKIQKEIDSLESSVNKYDNGLGDAEDRRELNYLRRELEHLEENYKKDIAKLTVKSNSK